jgi:phosphoenolpyruvate carboxykinase (ATP)
MNATIPDTIVTGLSNSAVQLDQAAHVLYDLSPEELLTEAIKNGEGQLADTGALVCNTGKLSGRAPKDRFIVRDETTDHTVDWGDDNQPFDSAQFNKLHERMLENLAGRTVYVRYARAGALSNYGLSLRIITTLAWHNLFSYIMFLRPEAGEPTDGPVDMTLIVDPSFCADPDLDGTRHANFTILNLTKGIILIGGTGYAGAIKKSVFSALNFWLPLRHDVLPMHCAANTSIQGDTALFLGLSGTGKTTLSADSDRQLIGDDEHGWIDDGQGGPVLFNFEGACYAQVLNLSQEHEPQLFKAIKAGAILENTPFLPNSTTVDYANSSLTANTRCAYPLDHIQQAVTPSVGSAPKHIFFLSADAFGVLPPISRLTQEQALDYFLLGYTAKITGTEQGVTSPMATFSPCFGAVFMPLHARTYAAMFKKRIEQSGSQVWLINTGWKGGSIGVGKRMPLTYTRAMIRAALTGALNNISFNQHTEFGLAIPSECPGVPAELLNPIDTWQYKGMYRLSARRLANAFAQKLTEL